jgi:hypothetical protein
MRIPRRTSALTCALLFSLAGAATAQADVTITSFSHSQPDDYTNDRTPAVTFTGAGSLDTVTLEVDSVVVGTTFANSSGNGTVTPTSAITSDPMDLDEDFNPFGTRHGITVRDDDGPGPTNMDTVTVHINQVPSIIAPDDAHVAADASVYVSNAIPDEDVKLYIDGALDSTVTADENGTVGNITPDQLLSAGTHTAYATSLDADGVESSPSATVNFDVAPAAPTFSQFFEGVQLNRAVSPVTFHNVDPTASAVTLYEIDDDGDEVEIGHTGVVTVAGTATVTPSALSDGRHYLVAKQTVSGVETVSYLGDNGPMTAVVNTSPPVVELSSESSLINDNRPYFYAENVLENSPPRCSTSTACPPGTTTATAAATPVSGPTRPSPTVRTAPTWSRSTISVIRAPCTRTRSPSRSTRSPPSRRPSCRRRTDPRPPRHGRC